MPGLITEDVKSTAKLLGDDLIIALVGLTGAGKSNIIDALTNQPGRRASSRLESCTSEVCAVRLINHPVHGDRLVLVDTPGFDDANKSDMQILEMISKWLQEVYEKDIRLAGIIYVHRITDNRTTGSLNRNFRMFDQLCGDEAMKKVVLVTTMWDMALASASDERRKILDKREKDLKDDCWKTMMQYGASTARFTNSQESAEKIINIILQQHEAEVLLLQKEIVDLKIALNETQAGKVLYSNLQKLLAEQRETVRTLIRQAQSESNPQLVCQLQAELVRIQKDFDKTFMEMNNLNISLGKRIQLFLSKILRAIHF